MKISNNWLKNHIQTDLKLDTIGEILTDIGLEVEGVEKFESIKGSLEGIVVGKVLTCVKHENADKLKVTTVDIGESEPLQIVCGAPNVEPGQHVPVATVGTLLYDDKGNSFEIKKAKIRGEQSFGMICAEDELGLGNSHDGIMVLDSEKYEVGKPLADYFELYKDDVFEIGLTPNRTDAMSHYGVARDLNAYLKTNQIKSDFEKISFQKTTNQIEEESGFSLEVEDNELCSKYIGAVIRNVTVEESPEWLQNKLKSIGLNPKNNIVDITNYILHDLGHPLHAFDAEKIKGKKIKVGLNHQGTHFKTLDEVDRKLNGSEIMIKDNEDNPLCMAGILGGVDSGVSSETKTIFLESAYFNPVAIRKAAKYHGLNTDASFRFERGIDPKSVKKALTYAIQLITDIAGGEVVGELLEYYPSKIVNKTLILRYTMLDQILGLKIHRAKVREILKFLDIEVLNEITNGLELSVPTYRADVTREIDVIEEILRIYGYNKVESPEKFSFTPVKLDVDTQEDLENFWARSLQSNGFNEVMNNSLTSLTDDTDAVKLLNPLSNELMYMRKSLLEGLLQNAVYNINRKNSDIKFFEFGKIYHKKDKYEERKQLAILLSGRNLSENWISPKEFGTFYHLKGYVYVLLRKLNLELKEIALIDERFSDIIAIQYQGKTIAKLGKLSSKYLKINDIQQDCFYAEIELEIAQKLRKKGEFNFLEIPKFNKIRRDLALLVDNNVTYADLQEAAKKNSSNYLKGVNLFDVYEGDKLPAGKKSYALSFELLNEEKTLEEKEITSVMYKLIKTFQESFNAELR